MSRRVIWGVILLVAALLLVIRASTGQGMGKSYVKDTPVAFQQDASGVWQSVPAGTAGAVGWTELKPVPPRVFYAAEQADPTQTVVHLSWSRTIGLWVAAFFTLAVLSFLYADNPFYKVAEAVVIGVSAAYWGCVGFWDAIIPKLVAGLLPTLTKENFLPALDVAKESNPWMIVPLLLGVLLLLRLVPKAGHLSLLPLAFIVGTTAGLKFISFTEGDLMAQVSATIKPLVQVRSVDGATDLAATTGASLKQILIFVGVCSALTYFFFSVEHKGAVGKAARVGIWYLMITFGAGFGFTVMGRIALLAARFEFLFDDWLWIIDPTQQRVVAMLMEAVHAPSAWV